MSKHEFLRMVLIERKVLIFPLSPYLIPWLCLLVVFNRTTLVDTGGNNLLCYQAPNGRNQRLARDVISTRLLPYWRRFSGKICFVTNVCLEMVWPMNRSVTCCCCCCCIRFWNLGCDNVRFVFFVFLFFFIVFLLFFVFCFCLGEVNAWFF